MSPVAAEPAHHRFASLDGLRGLAVLAVVVFHSGVFFAGWAGVDLFLVLSGFLITGILLDAKAAGGTGWRTYGYPFYMRRTLRILPLAYGTLLVAFVIGPALGFYDASPISEQRWYWGFAANMYSGPASYAGRRLEHLWSLSLEEQFYLLWPWVVLVVSRRRVGWICVGLLLLAPLARTLNLWAFLTWSSPGEAFRLAQKPILFRMDGLAAGALLAVLARSTNLHRWRVPAGWLAATCTVLFFVLNNTADRADWAQHAAVYIPRFSLLALGFASVTLLALTGSAAWLGHASLVHLGRISYGVYVIHHPVALLVRPRVIDPWPTAAVVLILTVALALASWHLFEQPILRWKSRWPMPSSPRSVTEPS